jgi:hypothetical protein
METMKFCVVLALLLFAGLTPDSNSAAQLAGPTIAVGANQPMKDGRAVAGLRNGLEIRCRGIVSSFTFYA